VITARGDTMVVDNIDPDMAINVKTRFDHE